MKRGPQAIGDVLSELAARRGIGRVRGAEAVERAWREAAGELIAGHSRVGGLSRGRLEVVVAHSTLVQELMFQKSAILRRMNASLPDAGIGDLRFRVGSIQ